MPEHFSFDCVAEPSVPTYYIADKISCYLIQAKNHSIHIWWLIRSSILCPVRVVQLTAQSFFINQGADRIWCWLTEWKPRPFLKGCVVLSGQFSHQVLPFLSYHVLFYNVLHSISATNVFTSFKVRFANLGKIYILFFSNDCLINLFERRLTWVLNVLSLHQCDLIRRVWAFGLNFVSALLSFF